MKRIKERVVADCDRTQLMGNRTLAVIATIIASLNNLTPVPVPDRDRPPDRDRRVRRNQYLLTVMEFVVRRPRWTQDCTGDPKRIGALRSSFLSHCYEH